MQKFTIFTAILAVTSLVVFAEVSSVTKTSNDESFNKEIAYSPDTTVNLTDAGQASVITALNTADELTPNNSISPHPDSPIYSSFSVGASVPSEITDDPVKRYEDNIVGSTASRLNSDEQTKLSKNDPVFDFNTTIDSSKPLDFEDEGFVLHKPVEITNDKIKKSGFKDAFISDIEHNNLLFKSISFLDIPNISVQKSVIKSTKQSFAMAYVFTISRPTSALSVYNILKSRLKQFAGNSDFNINESNSFGDQSFYFNDPKRPDIAFLVFKANDAIYCFSYPKKNHPQILNLISLLSLEFN